MVKNNIQLRHLQLRNDSIDVEKRTVDFVISDETVDSYETVFKFEGWDLSRFEANPVVFYIHDASTPNPDLALGTGRVWGEGSKLIGQVEFEPEDLNPMAEKVFRKIQRGTIRGASIRADVKDGRWGEEARGEDPKVLYFTRQFLTEFSIVPLPSNPNALKRNTEAIENFKKELLPVTDAEEVRGDEGDKGMSRFDAQLLINKNSLNR